MEETYFERQITVLQVESVKNERNMWTVFPNSHKADIWNPFLRDYDVAHLLLSLICFCQIPRGQDYIQAVMGRECNDTRDIPQAQQRAGYGKSCLSY